MNRKSRLKQRSNLTTLMTSQYDSHFSNQQNYIDVSNPRFVRHEGQDKWKKRETGVPSDWIRSRKQSPPTLKLDNHIDNTIEKTELIEMVRDLKTPGKVNRAMTTNEASESSSNKGGNSRQRQVHSILLKNDNYSSMISSQH